jgi:hypothetical protein
MKTRQDLRCPHCYLQSINTRTFRNNEGSRNANDSTEIQTANEPERTEGVTVLSFKLLLGLQEGSIPLSSRHFVPNSYVLHTATYSANHIPRFDPVMHLLAA